MIYTTTFFIFLVAAVRTSNITWEELIPVFMDESEGVQTAVAETARELEVEPEAVTGLLQSHVNTNGRGAASYGRANKVVS
jgi:hypothetical protein